MWTGEFKNIYTLFYKHTHTHISYSCLTLISTHKRMASGVKLETTPPSFTKFRLSEVPPQTALGRIRGVGVKRAGGEPEAKRPVCVGCEAGLTCSWTRTGDTVVTAKMLQEKVQFTTVLK